MPRDLWHLEGQQLRLLRDQLLDAHILMAHLRSGSAAIADRKVQDAMQVIEQILADGPHSRDEED